MELGNGRLPSLLGKLKFPIVLEDVTAEDVAEAYHAIREATIDLVAPLATEDYVVQSCPEASPPKWHLAHTTWFFETLVLEPLLSGYEVVEPLYKMLFNSYYESVGHYFTRIHRGTLSRPTVAEVMSYREQVDKALLEWIISIPEDGWAEVVSLIGLGLQHEQQHQELLMMDILANFAANPINPSYHALLPEDSHNQVADIEWLSIPEGAVQIGYDGVGFAYDNELPRHVEYLSSAYIANRTVTNGEFLEFLNAGGYSAPLLWLSDGWRWVNEHGCHHPRYWRQVDGNWFEFTLFGLIPLKLDLPVSHVSFYEADAYARWKGLRLPTEAEWEWAAVSLPITLGGLLEYANHRGGSESERRIDGNSRYSTDQGNDNTYSNGEDGKHEVDNNEINKHRVNLWSGCDIVRTEDCVDNDEINKHRGNIYRAGPVTGPPGALLHAIGGVWEWTRSPYIAYPGYHPPGGYLGEYNGKFMNGQYVLRGGCVATPVAHIRPTYRNFFQPESTWAFSGIRLARDES